MVLPVISLFLMFCLWSCPQVYTIARPPLSHSTVCSRLPSPLSQISLNSGFFLWGNKGGWQRRPQNPLRLGQSCEWWTKERPG